MPKKNSFIDKIEEKPKINNINKKKLNIIGFNDIKSEDVESKITQIRNNHSYEKDDLNSINHINKEKNEDVKNQDNNINRYNNNNNEDNYYLNNSNEEINLNNEMNISNDYNMNFYDTNRQKKENSKKDNNSSDVFQNLLPKKSFKKFLQTKIKYYMNEKEIPKEFIDNLKLDENNKDKLKEKNQILKNNISEGKTSKSKFKSIDYSNYYSEGYEEALNINSNKRNNKQNNNNNIYNKSSKNFYINNINKDFELNNNSNNNYDKVLIENKLNKEKIEDLKKELNNQKNEMNEKINKINILENMNDNLKNEMNKLQKNFEYERLNNKETKKNYDIIRSNYTDMKNQYDLLNIKYITLSDENFNYRRDKDLYEKQIKSKNEMIENLLENNSNFKKNKINNKLNKINYETKSSNAIISDYIKNDTKKKDSNNNIENKEKIENNENNKNNKNQTDNKFDKLSFPELQCKRDELIKERKDTYNVYCKIPLKSTSKGQINKRNMLEKQIEEINYDLMLVKLRLKNFKNNK